MSYDDDRNRVQWRRDRDFTENGITARVSILPLLTPIYSIAIGTVTNDGSPDNGRLSQFIGYSIRLGTDQDAMAGVVARVYADAESYVHTETQRHREAISREDRRQAQLRADQQLHDDEDRVRKQAKKQRYEQNKDARRDENRHASSRTCGK